MIDRPFRLWLEGLDPSDNFGIVDKKNELNQQLFTIAAKLGGELVGTVGTGSIFGRIDIDQKTGKKEILSSASAYNYYMASIRKILNIKAGDTNEQQ